MKPSGKNRDAEEAAARGVDDERVFQKSRATPRMRAFAERLIAFEAKENKSSEQKIPLAFVVCEKLRRALTTPLGSSDFRFLLSRALALANTEVAWLRAVHVKADGSLEGVEDIVEQVDLGKIAEGGVALIAQMFGILGVLIGEAMTLHLMREVWPKLALSELNSGSARPKR